MVRRATAAPVTCYVDNCGQLNPDTPLFRIATPAPNPDWAVRVGDVLVVDATQLRPSYGRLAVFDDASVSQWLGIGVIVGTVVSLWRGVES